MPGRESRPQPASCSSRGNALCHAFFTPTCHVQLVSSGYRNSLLHPDPGQRPSIWAVCLLHIGPRDQAAEGQSPPSLGQMASL